MTMLDTGTIPATVAVRAEPRVSRLTTTSALVGVLAAVVSLTGSWIPSLWGDEAASVLSGMRPFGSLLEMLTRVDLVHGLYYIGLHLWIDLFGSSPFSVRLPSAIAVGVAAAAVTAMCGRFGTIWFAVCAGVFTAVLPRMTYAGEEARSYAFDAAFAAVLCLILAELVLRRRPSRGLWIAYGAVLAISISSFIYLALMAVVAGVVVVLTPALRADLKRWLIASAAAVVLASPVLIGAYLQRQQVAFLAHREITADTTLVKMWFGALPFAVIAWTLIAIATAGYVMDVVRRRRAHVPSAPRLELIALACLIVPMGILIGVSVIEPGYAARYGTFAAPAAAVLMAFGVRRLSRVRWVAVLVALVVIVAAVPIWASQRTPYAKNKSDWNDIAATIRTEAVPGDAIVFDESVRPSRRPRLAMSTDPASFVATRDVTVKTPYADGRSWHDTAYTVPEAAELGRFDDVERVWLVEYARNGEVNRTGEASLQALGFRRVHEIDEHSSVIYLYVKPSALDE
jgi:mannosyltransferase